jgi:putative transposase
MPTGLERRQRAGDDHAINFICARRRPILGTEIARDSFLAILEETRVRYAFDVLGYVVMPNHVHLLLSEPPAHPLSTAIQVLKQRFSRMRTADYVWESRYYDFNVVTYAMFVEKLRYINRNPVRVKLVEYPEDWCWSSFRFYQSGEVGPVTITRGWEQPTSHSGHR